MIDTGVIKYWGTRIPIFGYLINILGTLQKALLSSGKCYLGRFCWWKVFLKQILDYLCERRYPDGYNEQALRKSLRVKVFIVHVSLWLMIKRVKRREAFRNYCVQAWYD
jgi:hypothetical protein